MGEIDSRSAEWTSKRAGERASGGQYNHSFTASSGLPAVLLVRIRIWGW